MIITGNSNLKDSIKSIDDFLISQNEVMNFNLGDPINIIKKQESGYYNLVSGLENNGVSNANELTVFEIYQRIEYYDDLHKKNSIRNKKD